MAVNVTSLEESELRVALGVEPVLQFHAGVELEAKALDVVGVEVSAVQCTLAGDGGAERAKVAQADAAVGDDSLLDFVLKRVQHGLRVGGTHGAALFDALHDGLKVHGRALFGHRVELNGIVHRALTGANYILEHSWIGFRNGSGTPCLLR